MADARVEALVRGFFARIEGAYANALENACRKKEIDASLEEIPSLGKTMLVTHIGMQVLIKSGSDKAYLKKVADRVLTRL